MRADPTRARGAFDEAIRYDAPVQTFFRTTTCDVEVDGATIPKDSKVLLFLALANRDPRRWQRSLTSTTSDAAAPAMWGSARACTAALGR